MNLKKQFMEGLITQNPVLVQVLGMCSTMAITTSFFNGLGMGVAVTVILTLSNVIISAIRKIVPREEWSQTAYFRLLKVDLAHHALLECAAHTLLSHAVGADPAGHGVPQDVPLKAAARRPIQQPPRQ